MTNPPSRPDRRRGVASRHLLLLAVALGPAVVVAKATLDPDGDSFDKVQMRGTSSVCLITVDGVAPYDLPLYNKNLDEDPFLTEFARLGVTVHHAYGAASTTPAAATAVLTGQLPSTHGVLDFRDRIHDDYMSLGELMQRRGLRTAAFSNVPILSQCGLDAGFEEAVEHVGAGPEAIGKEASRWLTELGEEYFFTWIHYYARPQDRKDRAAAFTTLMREVVEGLQNGRKYEGTFVIATGTYGRAGGDLSVPMLWKIPKRTAIGSKRNGPCSVLDIVPTLSDVFGLRGNRKTPGRNLVAPPDKPLYSGHYFTEPAGVLFEQTLAGRQTALGIRNHRWAVTQGPKPADIAAYKVEEDPGMRNTQIGTPDGDRAKSYLLDKMYERKRNVPHPPLPPGRGPVPAETVRQLESIGLFLGGG